MSRTLLQSTGLAWLHIKDKVDAPKEVLLMVISSTSRSLLEMDSLNLQPAADFQCD